MPESPDLTVVVEAFHAALAGRRIVRAEAPAPLAVRGTPAEVAGLVGQRLVSVRRRGKFLLMDLERDRIVVNPMLTGRFQLTAPGAKLPTKTAAILGFGSRDGSPPKGTAAWTRGAAWLSAAESSVEVRYRDSTQMGKVYLLPAGIGRAVPGLDGGELGPAAADPSLTLEVWRQRIRKHPGELKNLLKNQGFIAGVGNAYSDEILHEAQMLPLRKRSTLSANEIAALRAATRKVLDEATAAIRAQPHYEPHKQDRSFMKVHMRGGQPCPQCGHRIAEITARGEITSYCRGCQK